jgi:hypothetical protein
MEGGNNSTIRSLSVTVGFQLGDLQTHLVLRRLLKFLHTIGAVGLMGAAACLLVLLSFSPSTTSLTGYAVIRRFAMVR